MSNSIILSAKTVNETDATHIIQSKIDLLSQNNGGHLILTDGIFNCGSLELHSNIHLTISENAVLKFINQHESYPIIRTRWEGYETSAYRACLFANHVKNLTIDGHGIVDGNGFAWWEEFRKKNKKIEHARPYLVSIEHSKQIKIRDLFFTNSPSWTIHPFDCEDVVIDSISVKNPADSPNTDGTDPESCRNLRIINCEYDVGDDCIAIKAGTEDADQNIPCENLIISNCNMLHGHGGVVIGSEMSGSIRNVVINNCTFVDTDRGIRFKTRRGRDGVIENINISNIVIDNTLCPIVVNLYYFCGRKGKDKIVWDKNPYPINDSTPKIKHVRISNLTARHIRSCAAIMYGLPEMPIDDVAINDASFSLSNDSIPEPPAMFANAPKLAQKGFFLENTSNCHLTNISLKNKDSEILFHNVNNKNLLLKNLS